MASVIRGSGESTLGGNVNVQGVLTYEDVTSVDSVGVITARNGIRIPSGSLGIGTESPAGTFQLGDTSGSNVIIAENTGIDVNDGAINLYQATSNVNATPFIISTDVGGTETEKLRFTAGGKIGIGTDDPQAELHVNRTSSTGRIIVEGASIAQIGLRDNAGGVDSKVVQIRNSAQNLLFGTQNDSYGSFAERIRIDSDNTVHIGKRDGNSNSTHFGTSRLSICGPDPIATSVSKAGSYLAIGNNESELNGVYPITFGYTNNTNNHQPAYIAYKTTNSGGAEYGDLLFGTRNVTSDTEPTERLRVTSDGRVLVGIKTARAGVFNTNLITPFFQMESAGQVDHNRMMSLVSNPGLSGGYEPIFIFGKSRGTSAGDFDAVGNNDGLGAISWQGADGNELVEAARISASVDGAVNTVDDMPGRLDFWVTRDSAAGVAGPSMRIHNTGYMNVGGYIDSNDINRLNGINAPQGTHMATISGYQSPGTGGSSQDTALFYSVDASGGANAGATAIKVQRNSQTLRSINCAGSVNTSGNDYAEYMIKAGDFTIAKGDICGVNAQGKLTNVFADAVTFVVKSTDPSYVGGDTWDNAAGEEPGGYDDTRTGEELEAAKVAFKEQLEVVRQTVDRIAFCGQTPVNVTGTTPGQYIIPTANSDGSISGTAKSEGDLTLAEYMSSVGKVIAIEEDGRAKIIVKVS